MAESKASVTITYRKPGTQPPLFVAGTFSDPAWQPQEMDYTTDDTGEHTFQKALTVESGSKNQYKFRVGEGDWWVLDEGAPTATDELGNRNNLLVAPERIGSYADVVASEDRKTEQPDTSEATAESANADIKVAGPQPRTVLDKFKETAARSGASTPDFVRTAAEVADSAALLDKEESEPEIPDKEAGEIGFRRLSSTPISQVAETAAEVADTAQTLDWEQPEIRLTVAPNAYQSLADAVKDDVRDDSLDLPATTATGVPLFAHECIGLYEDDEIPAELPGEVTGENGIDDGDEDQYSTSSEDDDVDMNDPTLERFPSNRDEIMDTVRKMETGLNEDTTSFEGVPVSPVVGPRSNSISGITDFAFEASLSPPTSPTLSRQRLDVPKRPPSGVSPSDRSSSILSLDAIVEDEERDADKPTSKDIAPVVEQATTAEEAIQVAKEAEGEVALAPEKLTVADIAPIAEQTATAEDIITVAKKVEGGAPLPVPTPVSTTATPVVLAPSPSLTPATAAKTPASDEDEAVVVKDDEPKETSPSEQERSGSLTPERTASPRPPEPGATEEPAPNAAPPVPVVDTETAATVPGDVQAHSPEIVVHGADDHGRSSPATPGTLNGGDDGDGPANTSTQLKKRAAQGPSERAGTPASVSGVGREAAKTGNWFKAFFRLIFVDWIGGFMGKLFGTRRKALLTTGTAVAVVGVGIAWWKGFGKGN